MSKLITQDLISAVDWLRTSPPSWKIKAYEDLKNKLNRVYGEMSIEAKKGIELEDALNKSIHKVDLKCSKEFKTLIDYVKGYTQQKKTKSFLTIDNVEYCLYGKIDYYKPDHLIDLKSTSEYKGSAKYLKTYQHLIYCYNEKIKTFNYIIAEFESKESKKIKNIYNVPFILTDSFEDLKILIENKIKDIITFLSMDDVLYNLYNTKYCMFN
jgi:hypothetical protein